MKNKIILLMMAATFSGCANLEYAKNLKPEEMLYIVTNESLDDDSLEKIKSAPQWYTKIGINKAGFVGPDTSDERLALDKEYPIVSHSTDALTRIAKGINHKMRLGQAIPFIADAEKRTSGFMKDGAGAPISISGFFQPDSSVAITQGLTSGTIIGATSGVMAVSSLNSQLAQSGLKLTDAGSNAVVGGQVAQGLIAGLVAGGIHSIMAQSAFKEIVSAKSFGQAMQSTTVLAAHLLPTSQPLGPDGLPHNEAPIVMGPGVVKRYFLKMLNKTIDFKQNYALLTLVGTYRGEKYEAVYPNTLGWEYLITNMSQLTLTAEEVGNLEKTFRAIKREAMSRNLL